MLRTGWAPWLLVLVLLGGCDEDPRPGRVDQGTVDAAVDAVVKGDSGTGDAATADAATTDAVGIDAGLPCVSSDPTTWTHQALPSQSGMFRITFEATPSEGQMNGVTGLSQGAAAAYDDLAVIVRFNSTGQIDARDGAAYVGPTPPIPYSAGSTYRFRLEVDVPHGVYSAFVAEKGQSEQTIGTALGFRSTQSGVQALDSLGLVGSQSSPTASHQVCGAALQPAASFCGNGVLEPPETCDETGLCCDALSCVQAADGTACGSGGSCQQGSCVGGGEILRVDFDKQALDGYTQSDLQSDFELPGVVKRHWSNNHDRTDIVGSPEAYSGHSLRGKFLQGVVGGAGAPLNCGLDLLQPYEELYVSYRVKFHTGFDFVLGGKLPGVGGGAQNTGGNQPSSTDPEGFSVRMMWRTGGKVVFYVYHADQPGTYGEDFFWKCGGQDCVFTPGTWHTIEQRIVMNTAGQKDGIVQGWLDGKLAVSVSNLRFRDVKTFFAIDGVLWSNFFGGNTSSWAPTKDEWIYFDDFVLSKGPITH